MNAAVVVNLFLAVVNACLMFKNIERDRGGLAYINIAAMTASLFAVAYCWS